MRDWSEESIIHGSTADIVAKGEASAEEIKERKEEDIWMTVAAAPFCRLERQNNGHSSKSTIETLLEKIYLFVHVGE